MPAVAVAHVAAKRGQHQHGNLVRKAEDAKQRRRTALPVNQPQLGGRLHPGSDQGNQLPRYKQLKIAMSECAEARGHENNVAPIVGCGQALRVTSTHTTTRTPVHNRARGAPREQPNCRSGYGSLAGGSGAPPTCRWLKSCSMARSASLMPRVKFGSESRRLRADSGMFCSTPSFC